MTVRSVLRALCANRALWLRIGSVSQCSHTCRWLWEWMPNGQYSTAPTLALGLKLLNGRLKQKDAFHPAYLIICVPLSLAHCNSLQCYVSGSLPLPRVLQYSRSCKHLLQLFPKIRSRDQCVGLTINRYPYSRLQAVSPGVSHTLNCGNNVAYTTLHARRHAPPLTSFFAFFLADKLCGGRARVHDRGCVHAHPPGSRARGICLFVRLRGDASDAASGRGAGARGGRLGGVEGASA